MFTLAQQAARQRRAQKSENAFSRAEIDTSNDVPPEMRDLRRIAVDFSQVPIQPASPPVTMLHSGAHVTDRETVLTILCHDRLQSKIDICGEDRSLFHVEGARWGTSWSWRRKVFDDTTGTHAFDFRHESVSLKNGWIIEDSKGKKICSLVHKKFFTKTHSGIIATLRTQAGEDIVVDMRPSDEYALASTIHVGDQVIACIYKIAMETRVVGYDKDRAIYKVHVAAGVDLGFIVAMAMCRAEMGAVWAQ